MDQEFKKYFEANKKAFDEIESLPENLWDGIRMQINTDLESEEGKSNKERNWKQYFEENQKAFDEVEEVPIQLWDNIQSQLPQAIEKNKINHKTTGAKVNRFIPNKSNLNIMRFLKVAVMLVAAFGMGWFVAINVVPNNNVVDLQKMAPEVAEAETFYLTNIVAYKQDLQEYKQLNSELVEEFLTEHEALDALYDELKNMLLQDVDNEQILNLMIQNLQMRMTVLEKQKNILRNIQQQKKSGDVKTLL